MTAVDVAEIDGFGAVDRRAPADRERLVRAAVTEVGRYRRDDGLPVVPHESRELLKVGAALGQARHGVREAGGALALQGVAQGVGDGVLDLLRVGLHLAVP